MPGIVRTPDERFADLPGYDFSPNHVEIDGMRMHYVDEGPRDAEPVLMLHGEPSWSFLYRHMIPPVAAAGFRVIAPDFIGFGKSDKPVARADYSYAGHVAWMRNFMARLDLERVTLVGQDWGSLIGLRVAAENEHRFSRILLANGALPDGSQPMPKAFHQWRAFSQQGPILPVGRIIQQGTVTELSAAVVAAYEAPYPSARYQAGARQFPLLVPVTRDDPASAANQAAWQALGTWRKPFLTAFSDRDPIMRGADRIFTDHVPGAAGQAHTTIREAGHFLQEDRGPELSRVLIEFLRANPL